MNAVNLCIILVIIAVITVSIRKRTARIMQGFVGSGSGSDSGSGVDNSSCNLGGGGGGATAPTASPTTTGCPPPRERG